MLLTSSYALPLEWVVVVYNSLKQPQHNFKASLKITKYSDQQLPRSLASNKNLSTLFRIIHVIGFVRSESPVTPITEEIVQQSIAKGKGLYNYYYNRSIV